MPGRQVTLTTYEGRDDAVNVAGRLLGWITPTEFSRIMRLDGLQNQLYTVPTKPLMEVGVRDNVCDLRLALAIHDIDGEVVAGKKIFITAPVAYVCKFGITEDADVQIMGQESYYILSKKKEMAEA